MTGPGKRSSPGNRRDFRLWQSGRRSSEILNGASTFAPTARATTCLFGGQLKTRQARLPYEIPLLCEFGAFSNNLRALREAQGGRVLSASECNQRYAKGLQLALRRLYPMGRSRVSARLSSVRSSSSERRSAAT